LGALFSNFPQLQNLSVFPTKRTEKETGCELDSGNSTLVESCGLLSVSLQPTERIKVSRKPSSSVHGEKYRQQVKDADIDESGLSMLILRGFRKQLLIGKIYWSLDPYGANDRSNGTKDRKRETMQKNAESR